MQMEILSLRQQLQMRDQELRVKNLRLAELESTRSGIFVGGAPLSVLHSPRTLASGVLSSPVDDRTVQMQHEGSRDLSNYGEQQHQTHQRSLHDNKVQHLLLMHHQQQRPQMHPLQTLQKYATALEASTMGPQSNRALERDTAAESTMTRSIQVHLPKQATFIQPSAEHVQVRSIVVAAEPSEPQQRAISIDDNAPPVQQVETQAPQPVVLSPPRQVPVIITGPLTRAISPMAKTGHPTQYTVAAGSRGVFVGAPAVQPDGLATRSISFLNLTNQPKHSIGVEGVVRSPVYPVRQDSFDGAVRS